MLYTSVNEVKKVSVFLKDAAVSDEDIESFIIDAQSYIHQLIAKRYVIPLQPILKPSGTISTTINSNIIIGTDTKFTTDLIYPNQHLYIKNSDTLVIIDSIVSDTELTIKDFTFVYKTNNTITTSVKKVIDKDVINSPYYLIPEEIATATKYLAAKLLLMSQFSDKAYNQDTFPFYEMYQQFADRIIKQMESGNYYNALLLEQTLINNSARLVGISLDPFRCSVDIGVKRIIRNSLL